MGPLKVDVKVSTVPKALVKGKFTGFNIGEVQMFHSTAQTKKSQNGRIEP